MCESLELLATLNFQQFVANSSKSLVINHSPHERASNVKRCLWRPQCSNWGPHTDLVQ